MTDSQNVIRNLSQINRFLVVKGGRHGGTAHLLGWTRVVAFKALAPHDHGVGSGRLACPFYVAHFATCPSCRWQEVEAGNRAVADWGSGPVLIPCAPDDRIGRVGRPSPDSAPL